MSLPFEYTIPSSPAPLSRTYWVVDGLFLAGAYPGNLNPEMHRARVTGLFNAGMRTFINLMENDESNNSGTPFVRYDQDLLRVASEANERVEHLRFSIPDGGITTTDRMRSILDAIDLSLDAGRPVYIHCFGGMGRTGTTVCCWLLRHGFTSKDEVLQLLTQLRQADKERASWKAPENPNQERFVLDWNG